MNSLDDLRTTLDRRAHDLDDDVTTAVTARTAAVRGRVRTVRRRRRAVGAVGVAAVLATVGGVALLPRSDLTPAPASVVGVRVPTTMSAVGFEYVLSEGLDGEDGRVRLSLEASDEPRLVSWATSGADDEVVVRSPEAEGPVTYDSADFATYVYVPARSDAVVDVRSSEGDPGLAVYTLGDARPAGYTKAGVTYRQDTAAGVLKGAAVGDVGESEVSFPATAVTSEVGISVFCRGGGDDVMLNVDVGGEPAFSIGSCADVPAVDGAAVLDARFAVAPGDDLTTRVYATVGEDGSLVENPDVQVGGATYSLDDGPVGKRLIEADGHTWRFVQQTDLTADDSGPSRLAVPTPDVTGPVLATVEVRAGRNVEMFAGSGDIVVYSGNARGANGRRVFAAGQDVALRARGGAFREGDGAVVRFYEPAD